MIFENERAAHEHIGDPALLWPEEPKQKEVANYALRLALSGE